jgi:cytochrome c peroxidase
MVETDNIKDMYKFKTPALRNVSLTAPYGHNGAYPTLKGIIKQHLNPIKMNKSWKPAYANLPNAPWLEKIDFVTFSDKKEQDRILSSINIQPVDLKEKEIDQLVLFLESLTGKSGNQRPLGKPIKVPSGLTID